MLLQAKTQDSVHGPGSVRRKASTQNRLHILLIYDSMQTDSIEMTYNNPNHVMPS